MTKPMISPEFAAALQRVQEQRAKAGAEKMLQPKRRLLRRSALVTNRMPETSTNALQFLGATHLLGQKK